MGHAVTEYNVGEYINNQKARIEELEAQVRTLDLENRRLKNRIKRAVESFNTSARWLSAGVNILEIGAPEEGHVSKT